jgi:hypothetical protein
MAQFHETRMGMRFFERDVPELVTQMTKLNQFLEKGLKFEAEREAKHDRTIPAMGLRAFEAMQKVLWFDNKTQKWDPHKEWGVETIEELAHILIKNGYGPKEES